MKLRVIATLVAVLAFGVGSASAQSIGIFSDLGSASCNIAAPLYTPTTFYINVIGSESILPISGMTVAEFRVANTLNIGVTALVTSVPNAAANIPIGDPFVGGALLAFPVCQNGPSINLYAVNFTSINDAANANQLLSVVAHNTPSNANFDCSLINLCDGPTFTSFCVAGGEAWLNSPTDCTVAVEEKSWGAVKTLFN